MSTSPVRAADAAAERIKDEFTAMISHELRTPLCAAKEAVDLLADGMAGTVDPKQAPFLELASRNIARLSGIIDNVLDFGVLQRGQLSMNPERLLLGPFLESFLATHTPAGSHLALVVDVDPTVPQIAFDPIRLRQVLINVLDNALRHTQTGEIRFTARARSPGVSLIVSDTGCGIAEDDLERIFTPFYQVSTGTGRRVGGCGLGLALCKGLVELQGGRMWAESKLSHGTSIHLLLSSADETPRSPR